MKIVLKLFCFILFIYACYFPFSYFGRDIDKKEIRVSQILVKTQEEAEQIKKEINEGKKFKDILEDETICNYEKAECGDLGFTVRGKFVPELDKAIFKMSADEVSNPINSKLGWHLVKIDKINYYSESENFKYNPFKYLDKDKVSEEEINLAKKSSNNKL